MRLDVESIAFSKLKSENLHLLLVAYLKVKLLTEFLEENPDFLMPPPEANLRLSNREKAIILKWIDQGLNGKIIGLFIARKK